MNASAQGGRHAICQDGSADEKGLMKEPLRRRKSCTFMIVA